MKNFLILLRKIFGSSFSYMDKMKNFWGRWKKGAFLKKFLKLLRKIFGGNFSYMDRSRIFFVSEKREQFWKIFWFYCGNFWGVYFPIWVRRIFFWIGPRYIDILLFIITTIISFGFYRALFFLYSTFWLN